MWLIWSNEHQAWWGPGNRGYTVYKSKAGRYTIAEANLFTYDQTQPTETLYFEEEYGN
jgi:hypothetical protein